MSNPFSGIITQQLKDLHSNAIKSLLEEDALTVRCRIHYATTRYDNCVNCYSTPSPIGRKPTNTYLHGGPVPFGYGQTCPLCGGEGKVPIEATDELHLAVIFNPNPKFLPLSLTVNAKDGLVAQTFSEITVLPTLMRANYIVFDTSIEGYNQYKYERAGEPQPMGFGSNDFILVTWKRI